MPELDSPISDLITAVRDFYTANGRWPLGSELTGLAPAAVADLGLNPTAVSKAPGTEAEPGPTINPAVVAAGPPGGDSGSTSRSTEGQRSAPKKRPRRRRSSR